VLKVRAAPIPREGSVQLFSGKPISDALLGHSDVQLKTSGEDAFVARRATPSKADLE